MAANRSAVDHVLPVVGQPEIDQGLQHGIPHALLGPTAEADVDRVPLPIAFMHVPPGTANPQDVQHSVEIVPVISGRTRVPASLRRQQRPDQFPFRVAQVSAIHACLPKESLESDGT